MNQNGFPKPKIKTGFDLIRSVFGSVKLMNIEYSSSFDLYLFILFVFC